MEKQELVDEVVIAKEGVLEADEVLKEKSEPKKKKSTKRKVEKKITDNITLYADGKQKWVYELGLFRSPIIFWLVWKIFFFIILGIFVVVNLVAVWKENYFWELFLTDLKAFGIAFAGMTALIAIGYLVYAAIMGGKYVVLFEMDEKGIVHKQTASQAEKAKKIAGVTTAVGVVTANPTTAGIGVNASRTEMYTEFDKVKTIIGYPAFNLIKLNEKLEHNQVYVCKEDYDYVLQYLTEHCKNAVVRKH